MKTTAWVSLVVVAALSGCQLFDTRAQEGSTRRGPKGFDPYVGGKSGAVRLGLQMFKGCAILATGEPLGKGSAKLDYPDSCPRHPLLPPVPATPTPEPMPIMTGTDYFLGQLALVDEVEGLHDDPSQPAAPAEWITRKSLFNDLDWRGLGVQHDDFLEAGGSPLGTYEKRVTYGGANWMNALDDEFLVELVDGDGNVRSSQSYRRLDFLAQNPIAQHTRVTWSISPVGAPKFPGDLTLHQAPAGGPNDAPVGPPTSTTMVRIELATQAHPEKVVNVPAGLSGDGAFRVSWSQLPNRTFLFPVRFTAPETLPPSCYGADDTKVPCTFGIQPKVTFSTPANGEFYVPGESFEVTAAALDGAGNRLHPADALPSWNEYARGQSNGLMYFNLFPLVAYGEVDSIAGLALTGPTQNMRFSYTRGGRDQLFLADFALGGADSGRAMVVFPTPAAAVGALVGGRDAPVPTHYRFTVPADAPAGTYLVELKLHRQFLGERVTKATPFYFQVGQAERTRFPGRVGNCQLCHRGPLSLDNVRHGLPVDFIEGCKTCHNIDDNAGSRSVEVIHEIHMSSTKFTARQKSDCSLCHLTKESTLRPSLAVCGSCHPGVHGNDYFQMQLQPTAGPDTGVPDRFSNCAQSCHALRPPQNHLVPAR
ncbi:MAG: hypothetical protein K1X89_03190 [Myxococcaceae bacterium]|nr:hypothetical protein [Myxococcaceae bacterium]